VTVTALVVALILKPALLMAIAFGVTAAMRRTSAAARHAVWVGAIVAGLAMPLLSAALPALRWVDLEPLLRPIDTFVSRAAGTDASPAGGPGSAAPGQPTIARSLGGHALEEAAAQDRLARASLAIWLFVAIILVARRSMAEHAVQGLIRDSQPAPASVTRLSSALARRYDIAHPAIVRVSDEIPSPAVAGILRPAILLPPAAASWEAAELEAVIGHELGHAARRDCLLNFCADIAVSVYWCNPLVRVAATHMRREAERACDDIVLRGGAEPGAYAELLLRLARATHRVARWPRATTAMSRARELESRLIALLDGRVSRAPLSRARGALLAGAGLLLALPAAALTVDAAQVPLAQPMPPEPDRLRDSVAAPASERLPVTVDRADLERFAARALAGPDSMLARQLSDATARVPSHDADLVRDRAIWALSMTAADGRLVEPLLDALHARDWRVQSYAAWTLAVAGDARAVPLLIPLVRHPVWRLRAMAAHALQSLNDRRALDAMREALNDPAWQVRMEAVEFLAAAGGPEVEPLLRFRLGDRHIAVRRAARRALDIP
jgi:beta-lactamase regulating signal transducer with metallopeptidase domain